MRHIQKNQDKHVYIPCVYEREGSSQIWGKPYGTLITGSIRTSVGTDANKGLNPIEISGGIAGGSYIPVNSIQVRDVYLNLLGTFQWDAEKGYYSLLTEPEKERLILGNDVREVIYLTYDLDPSEEDPEIAHISVFGEFNSVQYNWDYWNGPGVWGDTSNRLYFTVPELLDPQSPFSNATHIKIQEKRIGSVETSEYSGIMNWGLSFYEDL